MIFFLLFPLSLLPSPGYGIHRNKYSGSVAASKPQGKVKCKHFGDICITCNGLFCLLASKSHQASGQSIGLCLEVMLFLPLG